jgi:hypothetical protein
VAAVQSDLGQHGFVYRDRKKLSVSFVRFRAPLHQDNNNGCTLKLATHKLAATLTFLVTNPTGST